jgi:hypothetical protein
VERILAHNNQMLMTKVVTSFLSNYRPELDISPLLNKEDTNWLQNFISILHWAVELGCVDIHLEVSMLASFLVNPREGHLDQCLHIFSYLKAHKKSTMVFDDTVPNVNEERFYQADRTEFYHHAFKALPPNAPEPRGNSVNMCAFIDTDNEGDKIIRCTQTGIILFLNRAPIYWYSKKQNAVETSIFSS